MKIVKHQNLEKKNTHFETPSNIFRCVLDTSQTTVNCINGKIAMSTLTEHRSTDCHTLKLIKLNCNVIKFATISCFDASDSNTVGAPWEIPNVYNRSYN